MLLCRKHKIDLIRQNSKHYYCPECDRLALLEAKRVFGCNNYGCNNGKRRYRKKCITCGIEIFSTRGDKKYCTVCLKARHKYKKVESK